LRCSIYLYELDNTWTLDLLSVTIFANDDYYYIIAYVRLPLEGTDGYRQ